MSTPEWHICISQCPPQFVPYPTFNPQVKNDTLLKGKLIMQNGHWKSGFLVLFTQELTEDRILE